MPRRWRRLIETTHVGQGVWVLAAAERLADRRAGPAGQPCALRPPHTCALRAIPPRNPAKFARRLQSRGIFVHVCKNRGRPDVFTAAGLKECRRSMADRHRRPDNVKGSIQVVSTLVPIAGLWYA